MPVRRSALVALLLGAALLRAWSLEVSQDRLKLVLHQGIGRFSLYLDGAALFVDQDPRTSGIALLLNNRVYKLGDNTEFRESAESLPGGARFSWTSRLVTVTESFAFQGPAAVSLSVTITNHTEGELNAGLRLLLDTYLGETGFPHFRTDRDREINGELSFGRDNMPAYWLSRSSRSPEAPGLQVFLRGGGVTTPERVVLANWKRLNESPWQYETSPARNFSDLPYSINDSAVCHYYEPILLPAGASRTFDMLLSGIGGGEAPAIAESARSAAATAALRPDSPRELGIQGDLRVLNGVLQQLARKLDSRSPFSEEELRLMEQILADLKNRLERYGD